MTRKTDRTPVETSKAESYARVGEEFFRAAQLAARHEYWTAAGLLYVHAAIAYADALAIKLSGYKSTSENHQDAVALLKDAARNRKGRDEALKHLEIIIDQKNRAAYTGQSFHARDIETMAKHAGRFQAWVLQMLGK